MFSSFRLTLFLFFASALAATANTGEVQPPRLGQQISEADVEAISTTVFPDGSGLPQGSGSAELGREIYGEQCASCHGDTGAGDMKNTVPPLAGKPKKGADWSTGASWPYAPAIFDYVRRAMPPRNLKQLSPDELYSVTAYILHMNGIVTLTQQLDRMTLPKVKMPAAGYFSSKWKKSESRLDP
ncbi:MAG: cytochrome c [Pseudomonadota bacterium]